MPCLKWFVCLSMLLAVADTASAQVAADAGADVVSAEQVHRTIERGLGFLERDAAKWRQEHSCATCHHGTLTVWAYAEAQRHGFSVAAETVRQTTEWTGERLERIDAPRDERPGWSMVNSPALYLAVMARLVPGQSAVSADQVERISMHLLRHQEQDGSWAWSSAPAKNRPPPFFESDEVATRLACLALAPTGPGSPKPEVAESLKKASTWLQQTLRTETTQAQLLELMLRFRNGETREQLQPAIESILKLQQKDGGWGQIPDRDSDAYATGQTLYFLSQIGMDSGRPEIERGRRFLVTQQLKDGSWPMVRRGHPGVVPSAQTIPIVYFGSAWGTLGLLGTSPVPRTMKD
jgi:hypothetical protein